MKEILRDHGIANRVRMTRSAHSGAFLLVEGDEDKKLYKQFIDAAVCQIQVAGGKPKLLSALAILEGDGFQGVLGIVDADFDVLQHCALHSPNIVRTDTHDLETMLIHSPSLDRLLDELGDEAKLAAFRNAHGVDVRHKILALGAPIGYLRWLSALEDMWLLFEKLPIERFVDDKSIAMNHRALLMELQNRSRQGILDEAQIQTKIDALRSPDHDLWHICCGHDLVRILSVALRRVLGSNKDADVKPELIEKLLRSSYAREHFEQTYLWAAIRAWEQANEPFLVLTRTIPGRISDLLE